MQNAEQQKRQTFARERSTDRADRWKILDWEQRRANVGKGQLALLQLQMGMACYRELSPQRPIIADFGPPNLRMSIEAL